MEAKDKQLKLKFREKVEEKINSFMRSGDLKTHKFSPMNKYQRNAL